MDFELLRSYSRAGDQQAFSSLVRRHLDLVYSTAVRRTEDHGGAEEVTQNVFAALARKAWQFAPDDSLPAWLHRATVLEAKDWLRGQLRRRRREQIAAELGTTMKASEQPSALRALLPILDEALLRLRETDRAALLLRYYEKRSLRDVGASLHIREDAAQKRVAAALERLARSFQRRGFKTVTGAVAAAALEQTAISAPALLAGAVAQAAAHLTPPAMFGLPSLCSRLAGLTKMQTITLCVTLGAVPLGWQWNQYHAIRRETVSLQSGLKSTYDNQNHVSAQIDQLRAEATRLGDSLEEVARTRVQNEAARDKWNRLEARIHALLTDADYHWPEDLPYVRIPKSVIKQVDLQGGCHPELLAMTPQEKLSTERALADYGREVRRLMVASAYETNPPALKPGRVAKTITVPPLGQELKSVAESTLAQIAEAVGTERAEMIFRDWAKGAIRPFRPCDPWIISETPQQLTVWVEPATGTNGPVYGASWDCRGTGGMSEEGTRSLSLLPEPVLARFFAPWLREYGISAADYLQHHE